MPQAPERPARPELSPGPATPRRPRVVILRAQAPAKPAIGAPCNGCGLCCAAEPCPLGMLLSRRRRGRCAALRWDAPQARYLCGALAAPERWLPALPRAWALRLVRRWIGASIGCDAELSAHPAPTLTPTPAPVVAPGPAP